ncbi:MAG: hypothetical protein V9E94_01195 [Microthrixaceae bacterium]
MATIDDLDVGAALTEEHFETAPRVFPRELPATSRREVARRARQIGMVTAKHFAPLAARSALTRHLAPDAYARPLRKTFEELGATFMKFGQLIGSSPGMFGDEVAAEFRSCLDTGRGGARSTRCGGSVEAELGMPPRRGLLGASIPRLRSGEPRSRSCTRPRPTTAVGRRGQGAASRRRAAGGPSTSTCSSPCSSFVARSTGEQAAGSLLADVRRVPGPDGRGARPAQRGPGHGPLPPPARARRPAAHLRPPAAVRSCRRVRVLTMEFIDGVPIDDLDRRGHGYGYDPRARRRAGGAGASC